MIEIKLNNELKSLKFSNYALECFTKITGSEIGEIKEISENYTQLDLIADIIYSGLIGNCRATNTKIDFTKEDVVCWVDDLSYTDQLLVIKDFTERCLKFTNQMLDAFKAMQAEGEKKK